MEVVGSMDRWIDDDVAYGILSTTNSVYAHEYLFLYFLSFPMRV